MLVSKLWTAFSVVLVLGLVVTGAALQTSRTAVGQEGKKEQPNGPAAAKEPNVTVRFLGGGKKVPLGDLNVTVRRHTGDWTDDHKKSLAAGKTDKDGIARFSLADGLYYVEITSDKALPYLNVSVGHKGYAGHYDRLIKVGKEQSFEFNLSDACKLTLRAVDAASGQGIPGVSFSMESQTGESGGVVIGDNVGADRGKQEREVTDKVGYLIRHMGPWDGYTYFTWPTPKGYKPAVAVAIPTPLGKATAEHVFRFKRDP